MPLQVIDDPTIGNAFAQLGNTIAAGPQKQIEAAHVAEQIRASQENRARLQQEFDAKNQIADHQANMDRLSSAKLAAGVNWTPDQENELQNARLRFSQAATRASALGGEGTEKGIWGSQGQGRMLVEQPVAGTPAFMQVYTATHGSPPDPTKEQKALANVQFTGPNGEIINRSTLDHKNDAQTGLPFDQIIPKGYTMLAAGSVTPTSPGGQFEAGPANASLLTATQQLQQGLKLTESPASLAAKYAHLFGSTNDIQRGPNGDLNIVGLQKTAGNPAFQPLHDYLQREYYDKGGRLPAPAGAGAAAATPAAPGAPAQPGGNVLPGAGAGGLFSPQSSVQTQTIPASQAPTARLPGSPAAAAAPNAPQGAPGAQTAAAQPYVWRPQAPPPLGGTQNVGGVANVTPITRGFDQQAASRVMQDPVMNAFHVSDRGYNELQRAAKYDNAYADLHMIYALAKIFDPISAVRGEELTLGQQAGPWADRLQGMWNYVRGGGRLDANARAMILDQGYTAANTNFETAANMLNSEQTKLLAQNLDPRAHLPEIAQPQPTDKREINRYGTVGYQPGAVIGDGSSERELIKIAGRLQGGTPGQTSTSAAGAPPATPQGAAARSPLRSGQQATPAVQAAPGAPKSSGNPLIDWADAQFRQGAR